MNRKEAIAAESAAIGLRVKNTLGKYFPAALIGLLGGAVALLLSFIGIASYLDGGWLMVGKTFGIGLAVTVGTLAGLLALVVGMDLFMTYLVKSLGFTFRQLFRGIGWCLAVASLNLKTRARDKKSGLPPAKVVQ